MLRLAATYPDGAGGGFGPWLMVRRSDDAVVGVLRCSPVDGSEAVAVGYEVARCVRGQGYATEALQEVVGHLLRLPGVSRVWADTRSRHTASRRVMEKAGLSWRHDVIESVEGRRLVRAHYAIDRPS